MILRALSALVPLLSVALLGAPLARSQEQTAPFVKQAQKNDDKDGERNQGRGKDGKDKGPPPQFDKRGPGKDERGKGGDKGPPTNAAKPDGQKKHGTGPGEGPPRNAAGNPDRNGDRAKAEAIKREKREAQQAKEKAVQQTQQPPPTGNFIQRKQMQVQQAKEKAQRDREEILSGRRNSAKQKLEAEAARQNALRQQREAEAARQNASKQQREAEDARKKALNQKQGDEQAQQKALRDKLEAERARQEMTKQKPFDAKQRPVDVDRKGNGPGLGRFNRAKSDDEFQKARERAQHGQDKGGPGSGREEKESWRAGSDRKFEEFRKGRKEREVGSRRVIEEPDRRIIVRDSRRTVIRHDESDRFKRTGREVRRDRRKDGLTSIVTMGLAGALIYTLQDDHGRLLRRSRKGHDGREVVLIDNRHFYHDHGPSKFGPERYYDTYVDLPPPVVRIPREKYIVEYEHASDEDIYDALMAPPIERLDRGYSLDQVRDNYNVLDRMRRVDLDAVNFDFGSWEVTEDQYRKLERIARAMRRILDRSPDEVFLIEGHTDAVGSDIDNLSLSDRRAESVAVALSDEFGIPPENLTTQGYGEQYLKVPTEEPSRINRRVSTRRITPLLSREGWNDPN